MPPDAPLPPDENPPDDAPVSTALTPSAPVSVPPPVPKAAEPGPAGVTIELPPALAALLKNPLVLAGGALVSGLVLSRFFATPPARRLARDLAEQAFKKAAPAAGTLAASTLLEAGFEKLRPHLTEYAKKILAETLRKKE